MTFGAISESRYNGRITNLFHVRYGEAVNSFYAYTDAEAPVTHNGVVYTPLPITRGKIIASGSLDKSVVEVKCSLKTPMAELFRVFPPSQVVNITIYQGHLSDPDAQFIAAYSGRVVSNTRNENQLILTCESIVTSLKRVGLRRHYQYSCPHVLYGDKCRASKAAATSQVTVESVSGMIVTLPAGWTTAERAVKYVNGTFEYQNHAGDREIRSILRVTNGRELLLTAAPRDLRPGAVCDIVLGCNHGLWRAAGGLSPETDCHFLHNNIKNYGGCSFIPTKNPVSTLNIYY